MGLGQRTGSDSQPPSPTAGQQQTTNLSASNKHNKIQQKSLLQAMVQRVAVPALQR